MIMSSMATLLLSSLFMQSTATWPDFRGPSGQGWDVDAKNLPTQWSESTNIVWKRPIEGKGWSTPVVAGQDVWFTTATNDGHSLRAISLNLDSGAVQHDVEVFAPAEPVHLNAKNSHASPSPLHDGKNVYVSFGTMGTACLDGSTGKIIWKNQLVKLDHKEGPGSSPILWRELLIINADGIDEQYVVALDRQTGQIVWRQDRPKPIHPDFDQCKAYSTPLVIDVNGHQELVSPGAMQVLGYDPSSGSPLWQVKYQGFSNVPRPLFGNGLIYVCTGYMKPQLWAIKPGGTGDVSATHVVWKFDRQVPANPSPILIDKQIYMVNNTGVLTCLDALTGRPIYVERIGGNFSASPLFADGKLYLASEEGVTTVLQPGTKFEKIAANELTGAHMASPVPVGQSLLLRTDRAIYRIAHQAEEKPQ
jgi:outer membrane protein assembly factor BamB